MEVLYDEVAVPKSPFRVGVTEGCDPTRVRAFGPGLEGGLVNKANRFTVETRYLSLCLTLTRTRVHLDPCCCRHPLYPISGVTRDHSPCVPTAHAVPLSSTGPQPPAPVVPP